MTDDEPTISDGIDHDADPGTVNLDVSGTVGPDHLGQETTDVRGHVYGHRYGVTDRVGSDLRHRQDSGHELPVLLDADMSSDPIEGTQGSYSRIVEGECARCGYDRLVESVQTMPGERHRRCNACGANQVRQADGGWSMPKTDRERADQTREVGVEVASLSSATLYDMESNTGLGPYFKLVTDNDQQFLLPKDNAQALVAGLVDTDAVDITDLTAVEIVLDLVDISESAEQLTRIADELADS